MQNFRLSELARNWSALKHAATRAPVAITERNRPRFVLMAIEDYDRLQARAADPRRAFRVDQAPDDLAQLLTEGLDRLIEDGERG